MTSVLILGGTGWLSGRVAQRWLAAGAEVTCLARGGRAAPHGARMVTADRDDPSAYLALTDRDWDEVVEISSRAAHVAAAVATLADRAGHWTYVSSISVYAEATTIGADESAAVLDPAVPGDAYDYGREKVAAELTVRSGLDDRVAIVRPGLIVGPGDPTDRFGYWVGRFALAEEGPVLVPSAPQLSVQVVDVEDAADFAHAVGRDGWRGTANAIGDPLPFGAFAEAAARSAGFRGVVHAAPDDWLLAHGVAHWMGPRSLPLWLPADMPGFSSRSHATYRAAGGTFRAWDDTLARTLADESARGLDRDRAAGLSREDELGLLAELVELADPAD